MMSCSSIEQEYEALLQFLYIAPIGLAQARMDGEIVLVNPPCAQLLLPLSRDGELTNLFAALENLVPDLRQRVQAFNEPQGMICEGMHLHVCAEPQGRRRPQVLALTLLKLDGERLMAVLGDVTQSVKRERELRQSQAWIQTLVNGLSDYALVLLDAQGQVRQWHPSIGRVTGFEPGAVVQKGLALFYPQDAYTPQAVADRLREADECGWSLDEGWRVRADGSRFWGSCLIAPLPSDSESESDGHERSYSLIIRDVSDRREATEALRKSVWCDHLTGLANRRAFFEAAEGEMRRWERSPRPLSLVMIDADNFKQINDRHGHQGGDAVLRHLAAGLSANFREHDTVARLGGEEFVVLLPGAGVEDAEAVVERLRHSLQSHAVEVGDQSIRYTVSAGVATMEPEVAGINGLLERADAALYQAKARGRNRVERWDGGGRAGAQAG